MATGELALFKEIWGERPHESEISGEAIWEFSPVNFAHILPKGTYGKYRLNKDNIVIMAFHEHMMFDHETHKAKADKRFDWVFEKKERLKAEYNQLPIK